MIIPTNTFVIVHAAWQGPYAWAEVKEQLLAGAYDVELIQLPAHGNDLSKLSSIHLDTYVQFVIAKIKEIGKPVILAGHSFAGMIISAVGELLPSLISKLVYIAAYVPQNGQSAYAISGGDKQSLLGRSLSVTADQLGFDVKREDIINIFAQDATPNIQQLILNNYRTEPAAPFAEQVELTEANFRNLPKAYIETLFDNGIGNNLQKEMIRAAGITEVYTLNTGHTPSLTQPSSLANALYQIAKKE